MQKLLILLTNFYVKKNETVALIMFAAIFLPDVIIQTNQTIPHILLWSMAPNVNILQISDQDIITIHQLNLYLLFMDVLILTKMSNDIIILIEFGIKMLLSCIQQDYLQVADVDEVMDEILVMD